MPRGIKGLPPGTGGINPPRDTPDDNQYPAGKTAAEKHIPESHSSNKPEFKHIENRQALLPGQQISDVNNIEQAPDHLEVLRNRISQCYSQQQLLASFFQPDESPKAFTFCFNEYDASGALIASWAVEPPAANTPKEILDQYHQKKAQILQNASQIASNIHNELIQAHQDLTTAAVEQGLPPAAFSQLVPPLMTPQPVCFSTLLEKIKPLSQNQRYEASTWNPMVGMMGGASQTTTYIPRPDGSQPVFIPPPLYWGMPTVQPLIMPNPFFVPWVGYIDPWINRYRAGDIGLPQFYTKASKRVNYPVSPHIPPRPYLPAKRPARIPERSSSPGNPNPSDKLQKQIDSLNGKLNKANNQIKNLQKNSKPYGAQPSSLQQNEIDRLKGETKKLAKEIDRLNKERLNFDKANGDLKDVTRRLEEAERQLKLLPKEKELKKTDNKDVENNLKDKVAALKEQKAGLKKQVAELKERIDLANHDGLERHREITELKAELQISKERLSEAQSKLWFLEEQLDDAHHTKEALLAQNRSLSASIEELSKAVVQHQLKIEQLEAQNKEIERRDRIINDLERELDHLRREGEFKNIQLNELEDRLRQAFEEKSKQEELFSQIESELKAELSRVMERLRSCTEELEQLQKENYRIKEDLHTKDQIIEKLEKELSLRKLEIDQLRHQLQDSRRKLELAEHNNEQIYREIEQLKEQLKNQEITYQKQYKDLQERKERELKDKADEINHLKARIDKLVREGEETGQQQQKKIEELQRHLQEMTAQYNEEKAAKDKLEQGELQHLREKVKELDGALKTARLQLQEAKTEGTDAEKKYKEELTLLETEKKKAEEEYKSKYQELKEDKEKAIKKQADEIKELTRKIEELTSNGKETGQQQQKKIEELQRHLQEMTAQYNEEKAAKDKLEQGELQHLREKVKELDGALKTARLQLQGAKTEGTDAEKKYKEELMLLETEKKKAEEEYKSKYQELKEDKEKAIKKQADEIKELTRKIEELTNNGKETGQQQQKKIEELQRHLQEMTAQYNEEKAAKDKLEQGELQHLREKVKELDGALKTARLQLQEAKTEGTDAEKKYKEELMLLETEKKKAEEEYKSKYQELKEDKEKAIKKQADEIKELTRKIEELTNNGKETGQQQQKKIEELQRHLQEMTAQYNEEKAAKDKLEQGELQHLREKVKELDGALKTARLQLQEAKTEGTDAEKKYKEELTLLEKEKRQAEEDYQSRFRELKDNQEKVLIDKENEYKTQLSDKNKEFEQEIEIEREKLEKERKKFEQAKTDLLKEKENLQIAMQDKIDTLKDEARKITAGKEFSEEVARVNEIVASADSIESLEKAVITIGDEIASLEGNEDKKILKDQLMSIKDKALQHLDKIREQNRKSEEKVLTLDHQIKKRALRIKQLERDQRVENIARKWLLRARANIRDELSDKLKLRLPKELLKGVNDIEAKLASALKKGDIDSLGEIKALEDRIEDLRKRLETYCTETGEKENGDKALDEIEKLRKMAEDNIQRHINEIEEYKNRLQEKEREKLVVEKNVEQLKHEKSEDDKRHTDEKNKVLEDKKAVEVELEKLNIELEKEGKEKEDLKKKLDEAEKKAEEFKNKLYLNSPADDGALLGIEFKAGERLKHALEEYSKNLLGADEREHVNQVLQVMKRGILKEIKAKEKMVKQLRQVSPAKKPTSLGEPAMKGIEVVSQQAEVYKEYVRTIQSLSSEINSDMEALELEVGQGEKLRSDHVMKIAAQKAGLLLEEEVSKQERKMTELDVSHQWILSGEQKHESTDNNIIKNFNGKIGRQNSGENDSSLLTIVEDEFVANVTDVIFKEQALDTKDEELNLVVSSYRVLDSTRQVLSQLVDTGKTLLGSRAPGTFKELEDRRKKYQDIENAILRLGSSQLSKHAGKMLPEFKEHLDAHVNLALEAVNKHVESLKHGSHDENYIVSLNKRLEKLGASGGIVKKYEIPTSCQKLSAKELTKAEALLEDRGFLNDVIWMVQRQKPKQRRVMKGKKDIYLKEGGSDFKQGYLQSIDRMLNEICLNHGLVEKPAMAVLLIALEKKATDINSPVVVILSERYSREEGETSNPGVLRNEKFLNQCQQLLAIESASEERLKGSHQSKYHQQELECFKKGKLNYSSKFERSGKEDEEKTGDRGEQGLLDTFFDQIGVDKVVFKQHKAVGEQMAVDKQSTPALIFIQSKNSQGQYGKLSVDLLGSRRECDQRLYLSYPDYQSPFKGLSPSGQLHRDSIPLSDTVSDEVGELVRVKDKVYYFRLVNSKIDNRGGKEVPVLRCEALNDKDQNKEILEGSVYAWAACHNKPECQGHQSFLIKQAWQAYQELLKESGEIPDIDKFKKIVGDIIDELHGVNRAWFDQKSLSECKKELISISQDKFVDVLYKSTDDDLLSNFRITLPDSVEIEKERKGSKTRETEQAHIAEIKTRRLPSDFALQQDKYTEFMRLEFPDKHGQLDRMVLKRKNERDQFVLEVFPDLTAFKGTQLSADDHKLSIKEKIKRLNKSFQALKEEHLGYVEDCAKLERSVFAKMPKELLPCSIEDAKNYFANNKVSVEFARVMMAYMIAESGKNATYSLIRDFGKFISATEELERNRRNLSEDQFKEECQRLNFLNYDICGRLSAMKARLISAESESLTVENISARLYEAKRKTLLRDYQVKPATEITKKISEMAKPENKGKPYKINCQWGTGFGKTEMAKLYCMQACREGLGAIYIAPEENVNNFDVEMSRFARTQGYRYQRINIRERFEENHQWWVNGQALSEVLNMVRGLPVTGTESGMLIPASMSTTDLQSLLQLHQAIANNPEFRAQYLILDEIIGVLTGTGGSSHPLIIRDECDTFNDADDISRFINQSVLNTLNTQVSSADIIELQLSYDTSLTHGIYMSASTNTEYGAALLANAESVDDVEKNTNKHVTTCEQRSERYLLDSKWSLETKKEDLQQTLEKAIDSYGPDRDLIVCFPGFSGNNGTPPSMALAIKGEKAFNKAIKGHRAKKVLGHLYFKNGEYYRYTEGHERYGKTPDNNNGVLGERLTEADEAEIRKNGGRGYITWMTETRGYTAAQNKNTVFIFKNLFGLSSSDIQQALGRDRNNDEQRSFDGTVSVSKEELEDWRPQRPEAQGVQKQALDCWKEMESAKRKLITEGQTPSTALLKAMEEKISLDFDSKDSREDDQYQLIEKKAETALGQLERKWKTDGVAAEHISALKTFKKLEWKTIMACKTAHMARRVELDFSKATREFEQAGSKGQQHAVLQNLFRQEKLQVDDKVVSAFCDIKDELGQKHREVVLKSKLEHDVKNGSPKNQNSKTHKSRANPVTPKTTSRFNGSLNNVADKAEENQAFVENTAVNILHRGEGLLREARCKPVLIAEVKESQGFEKKYMQGGMQDKISGVLDVLSDSILDDETLLKTSSQKARDEFAASVKKLTGVFENEVKNIKRKIEEIVDHLKTDLNVSGDDEGLKKLEEMVGDDAINTLKTSFSNSILSVKEELDSKEVLLKELEKEVKELKVIPEAKKLLVSIESEDLSPSKKIAEIRRFQMAQAFNKVLREFLSNFSEVGIPIRREDVTVSEELPLLCDKIDQLFGTHSTYFSTDANGRKQRLYLDKLNQSIDFRCKSYSDDRRGVNKKPSSDFSYFRLKIDSYMVKERDGVKGKEKAEQFRKFKVDFRKKEDDRFKIEKTSAQSMEDIDISKMDAYDDLESSLDEFSQTAELFVKTKITDHASREALSEYVKGELKARLIQCYQSQVQGRLVQEARCCDQFRESQQQIRIVPPPPMVPVM
ncbi:hypothetical protein [Endozoicomonas sp. Mp262]|uniref:hypothetical protein n=1 Tax=Endozoicomonas sp. Mp262 TaxID=2919499 RepID=UPI0021DA7207